MYENQVYLPDVFHLRYSAILSPALLVLSVSCQVAFMKVF